MDVSVVVVGFGGVLSAGELVDSSEVTVLSTGTSEVSPADVWLVSDEGGGLTIFSIATPLSLLPLFML